MPEPTHLPHVRSRHTAAIVAVTLVAAAVYANSLQNGFALDDEHILLGNPVVHGFSNLRGLLLEPYWPRSEEMYRPLTMLTFAAGWALHGADAALLHLGNVVLHAAVSAVVVVLLLRLGSGLAAAALGGLLFAVHPVHVEAVSNLVGRAELLATLLFLLACFVYLGGRSPPRIAAVCALYLGALLAKESAVTLPAALVLLDALAARRSPASPWALLRRNGPVLAAVVGTFILYVGLRATVSGAMLGTTPAPYFIGLSHGERLAVAARLWPEFLRLMFWPRELSVEWGPDAISVPAWNEPLVWAGVAIVLLLAYAAVRAWHACRWITVAILWFGATALTVSQIPFPVGVMLAERTLYLPSVALCFLVPPLVSAVRREREGVRAAAAAAGVLLLVLASVRTWTRTPVWSSTSAVFDSMVEKRPEVWWVEWRAGQLLVAADRWREGLPWYERAMRKTNGYHHDMVSEYARLLLFDGRPAEAELVLRRVLEPFPRAAVMYVHLSSALLDQGRFAEADAMAVRAREVDAPATEQSAEAAHRRALALDLLGMPDSALAERRRSLETRLGRSTPATWYHLARLLVMTGDDAGARAAADSARVRVAAAFRPHITLDPLPLADHPAFRGWVPWSPGEARGIHDPARQPFGPEGWLAPPGHPEQGLAPPVAQPVVPR
jgi:protein O-mannosyl-transferase